VTTYHSLLISKCGVSPSQLLPSLHLSEYMRFGASSKAFGWCCCHALGVADCSLQCPFPETSQLFTCHARFRQPWHPGGVFAAAEVSCRGKLDPGELRGIASRGPWTFSPLLPRPANYHVLSPFSSAKPGAAVSARESGLSSPALPSLHQHTGSMDTELDSHCHICLDGCQKASYVLPFLFHLHPAVDREQAQVPPLQEEGEIHCALRAGER